MCFAYPDTALSLIKNISKTLQSKEIFISSGMYEESSKSITFTNDFETLQNLAQSYGITVPMYHLATKNEDIETLLDTVNLPAMLKVVDGDVLHRSDKKMVQKATTVEDIYQFCEEFKNQKVALCELVGSGIEIFIGIKNDDQFGLSLLIGSGGIYSEIWKDVVCIPLPATSVQILACFKKTKVFKIIDGYRNLQWDTDSVIQTATRLYNLAITISNMQSIEINPLIVHPIGSTAVDIKISLNSN
jgi:succinyl-CoA synthetase beta subunit